MSFFLLSIILCIAHVCSVPTRCEIQQRLVETCYHLLDRVGDRFPLRCLKDKVSVSFPKAAFVSSTTQQTVSIEKAVYTTLKYIDSIFDNELPEQWTSQKKLDCFQNVVFRLIDENRCIMSKTQDPLDDFQTREASLRAYFDKIIAVLNEQSFRYCAWEFVRTEIVNALQFILNKDFQGRYPMQASARRCTSAK